MYIYIYIFIYIWYISVRYCMYKIRWNQAWPWSSSSRCPTASVPSWWPSRATWTNSSKRCWWMAGWWVSDEITRKNGDESWKMMNYGDLLRYSQDFNGLVGTCETGNPWKPMENPTFHGENHGFSVKTFPSTIPLMVKMVRRAELFRWILMKCLQMVGWFWDQCGWECCRMRIKWIRQLDPTKHVQVDGC